MEKPVILINGGGRVLSVTEMEALRLISDATIWYQIAMPPLADPESGLDLAQRIAAACQGDLTGAELD